VTVISAGNCTIQASQTGTNQYAPATSVSVTASVATASSTAVVSGAIPLPATFPQIGSTYSDSSTTIEGVYEGTKGLGFIDSANNFNYGDTDGTLFGILQPSGLTWTLAESSVYYSFSAAPVAATGSGTFKLKNTNTLDSFVATTQSFPTTAPLNLVYGDANGYAVSQSSIVGNWLLNTGTGQILLSIDNSGAITGILADINTNNTPVTNHQCTINGTMLLADPNTSHNLFNVVMNGGATANSGTTCDLSMNSYKGLGAIRYYFANSNNGANGLFPVLTMIVRTSDGSHLKLSFAKQNY
jgi:hypothetical protein